MMVFTVGRWLWHLSTLHRFDDPPPRIERASRAHVPVFKRFPWMDQFLSRLAY
jgi:hypothetical protein